jgi:hypothetical protein
MRAYKGLVKDGKIILAEGAELPEGAVVTITIGEAEYIKASLRSALLRNQRRRSKVRVAVPALTALLAKKM